MIPRTKRSLLLRPPRFNFFIGVVLISTPKSSMSGPDLRVGLHPKMNTFHKVTEASLVVILYILGYGVNTFKLFAIPSRSLA